MKAVFYQSIGPELARYDIDVDGAALIRRDSVTTPGANVQYVWPHPSKKFLYVVSSDGGPGTIPGTRHVAAAFRIDPASGALTPHGDIAPLPAARFDRRSTRSSASFRSPRRVNPRCSPKPRSRPSSTSSGTRSPHS